MEKERELKWDDYASAYGDRIRAEFESDKKHEWVQELERRIVRPNGRILDIGTGPGFISIILAEEGYEVTGIDKSLEMLEIAKQNAGFYGVEVELHQEDAEKLSFHQEMFDVVIARNVSYALSYPEKAFREWMRVLKTGGKILIYDANWFYFLFDKREGQKMETFLEEYHKKTGHKHPTYEEEAAAFASHIMSRPMSKRNRPRWDIEFWKGERAADVCVDSEIGGRLYGEEYVRENRPTPFFVIEVTK